MTTSQILLDEPSPARGLATSEATVTPDEELAWLDHTVAPPSVFGRTLSVRPRTGGHETLVAVEDAIAANVGLLFPESHFSACCPFRITRRRLRETSSVRPGPRPSHPGPVRLEIAGATPDVESLLQSHLGLEDWDICRVSGTLRLGDLSTLGYRALQ